MSYPILPCSIRNCRCCNYPVVLSQSCRHYWHTSFVGFFSNLAKKKFNWLTNMVREACKVTMLLCLRQPKLTQFNPDLRHSRLIDMFIKTQAREKIRNVQDVCQEEDRKKLLWFGHRLSTRTWIRRLIQFMNTWGWWKTVLAWGRPKFPRDKNEALFAMAVLSSKASTGKWGLRSFQEKQSIKYSNIGTEDNCSWRHCPEITIYMRTQRNEYQSFSQKRLTC